MAEMEEELDRDRGGTPAPYISPITVLELPFDIMNLIFAFFPMEFVFAFRLVCRYWNESILNRCSITKHLILKLCCVEDRAVEYDTELINFSGDLNKLLRTNQVEGMILRESPWRLTFASVDFLLLAFEEIESFTIQYNGCSPEDGIPSLGILLRQLSVSLSRLEGFTFWYIPKGTGMLEHSTSFLSLYSQINESLAQMTSLKRLNICVDSDDMIATLKRGAHRLSCLNVLPQLEQFGLNVYVVNLDEVIARLNPIRLTHLSLDCEHFESSEQIERLFRVVNPGLTSSVTHLQLNHPVNPKHLMIFCSLFANCAQQLTIAFHYMAFCFPHVKLYYKWLQDFSILNPTVTFQRPNYPQVKKHDANALAVINHDTIKALSRISQLKELTLINCLLDPNRPANCEDLSLPKIEKLTLEIGGPFVPKYLYLIKENLEAIRHIKYNHTSAQEFYTILSKQFPKLKELTICHTNQPHGPEALPRTIFDASTGPLKDIFIGWYYVSALHKSHYRTLPNLRQFTARLEAKVVFGQIRHQLIASCDINNHDALTMVCNPVNMCIHLILYN